MGPLAPSPEAHLAPPTDATVRLRLGAKLVPAARIVTRPPAQLGTGSHIL